MIQNIETYVLLFTIYAIIGWLMEVSLSFIQHHKFVNRGFLIGPYCPIYGFGGVAITLLLSNFMKTIDNVSLVDSIWISTIVIMFICGTLEYITSWLMEKLFHARWWDYHRFKFNINGRVCLETLLPFTIIGQIILRFGSPAFLGIISNIHQPWLHIITAAILVIFAVDLSVSYNIIHSFKKISNEAKDNTEEITKKVKSKKQNRNEIKQTIDELEQTMKMCADNLNFEEAIKLRDEINNLKKQLSKGK